MGLKGERTHVFGDKLKSVCADNAMTTSFQLKNLNMLCDISFVIRNCHTCTCRCKTFLYFLLFKCVLNSSIFSLAKDCNSTKPTLREQFYWIIFHLVRIVFCICQQHLLSNVFKSRPI